MLTFSMISVALANTTGDPTATYVIIGVIIFFLIVAASSGTSAKKVVKKYYCPHCQRQINFTAPVIKPVQHSPYAARGQRNNVRLSNQPRMIFPRQNAPVEQRGGKKYCPYCKKEIRGS